MNRSRLNKARRRRNGRTFVGYIGLLDGRPDVIRWPNQEGQRTIPVFLSERKARRVYEDVQLVIVTGVYGEVSQATSGD